MAGVLLHVNSGEVALVANTPKTVLAIKAPTNQRLLIRGLKFLGKSAAGGTDVPVKVRLTRSTANFGTGSTATPAKNDPNDGETVQSTAASNFTVEPTSPTDGGLCWEFSPQGGIMESLPPDVLLKVPGGQSVQFEMTAPGAATALVTITYEE